MTCSSCKISGHNIRTCIHKSEVPQVRPKITRKCRDGKNTEELGKSIEMSVCKAIGIDFCGVYKYDHEKSEKLRERLERIRQLFPFKNVKHTASKGARYDITGTNPDGTIGYISIKSSKTKDAKVCPQVIGQPCYNTFCDYFSLPRTSTTDDIKKFIIDNTARIMFDYFNHTFDCDIFYYNEYHDKCLYIKTKDKIDWDKLSFEFSRDLSSWNESTTLRANIGNNIVITIGEFQLHNNRNGIKFRWNFEKLLNFFTIHFHITEF